MSGLRRCQTWGFANRKIRTPVSPDARLKFRNLVGLNYKYHP